MADSEASTEKAALEAWYKSLLDQVVKEMIRLKAVSGVAVQASPVWMVPNEILMAKVWSMESEADFVWTISVDKLIADYVAGSLAATPREVARHFSLKWQMDADRLQNLDPVRAPVVDSAAGTQVYAKKLIHYAEMLYDLAERDDAWQDLPPLSG